jgi:hypothetical protein
MNTSYFRHDGSTRGFCTTDPERQGVVASASRLAAMQAVQGSISRLAQAGAMNVSRPQPSGQRAQDSFGRSGRV